MYLALSGQASIFLYSGLFGALLGVIYDIVRVIRRPCKKLAGMCIDAVFVLIACLLLLGFVLTVANGQIRLYVLLGLGLGWMIYAFTLSPTVYSVFTMLARGIRRVLSFVGEWIYRIFSGIRHLILRLWDGHRKKKETRSESSDPAREGEVLWQREEKNESGFSRNSF